RRVDRGLIIVRRMFRRSADDRAIGVATVLARRYPEPLVRRVVAARVSFPGSEKPREPAGDRIVLVGAARHRDDHAVEELVATLAGLLDRHVVGVGRAPWQSK